MIDISKQYRTRDGREVRIYATGGESDQAVHGAVLCDTEWRIFAWYNNGQYSRCESKCKHDLIEVCPRHKRTVWLHVFKNGSVCATEETFYVPAGRIACIKVELDFEEGEGL